MLEVVSVKVKSKATTTLMLSLVVALVVMGIAYAMWDKSLYIEGTVNTGDLDVIFANVRCNDEGPDPGGDKEGKNVGSCSWSLSEDSETMTVTIDNAYPCYYCIIEFDLVNVGTIPVKIQSVSLSNPHPDELTVSYEGLVVGTQIDPDGSVHACLYVHLEQPAEEGASYSFTITILVVQWNEYEE